MFSAISCKRSTPTGDLRVEVCVYPCPDRAYVTKRVCATPGLENDEYVRQTDGYLPTAEVRGHSCTCTIMCPLYSLVNVLPLCVLGGVVLAVCLPSWPTQLRHHPCFATHSLPSTTLSSCPPPTPNTRMAHRLRSLTRSSRPTAPS